MRHSYPGETRPAASRTVAAFTVGILVGIGLAFPALPPVIGSISFGGFSTGPVGAALITGTLLVIGIVTGMWALYLLFAMAER